MPKNVLSKSIIKDSLSSKFTKKKHLLIIFLVFETIFFSFIPFLLDTRMIEGW